MRLFSDQIRLLLSSYQADSSAVAQSRAVEAVDQAYRKIGGCHPWSYLHRITTINTNASASTGTIAYTASTNVMTLTGATWPSWAAQGLLIISGHIYAVQTVLSSTTLSCVSGRAPTSDIASGTGYILMQSEYVLPTDFNQMEEFVSVGNFWITKELPPGSALSMQRMFYNPARPWYYLVRGSTYYRGKLCIEFSPPPDIAYTYQMSYYAKPRPRTLEAPYVSGSVAVDSTGLLVTGTGTAFTQAMVGCQIRLGTTSTAPVGEYGVNGSIIEGSIATVTDATHLTLVSPIQTTSAGTLFVIDDPIDIERGAIDEAFCRVCEYQFEMLTRSESRQETHAEMIQALREARARDCRTSTRNQITSGPSFMQLAYSAVGGH